MIFYNHYPPKVKDFSQGFLQSFTNEIYRCLTFFKIVLRSAYTPPIEESRLTKKNDLEANQVYTD